MALDTSGTCAHTDMSDRQQGGSQEVDTDLQVRLSSAGEIPVLELEGEVDAYTCSSFRDAMYGALDTGGPDLIISMRGVAYIDSTGLGALVGALKRVSEKNGHICVVCTTPQVVKVLQITGLVKVFPLFSTLEEAQTALESGAVADN